MYTPLSMKLNSRWRRLTWRLQNPTYAIFISSATLSLFAFRAFGTSYGPSDTHRAHLEADGSYLKRRFAEVNDNPLYRLPENPAGGHRLDGKSPQQVRREALSHH